ncbi:hypothetical protein LBMAG24_03480 [Bacteroidota bacterium]|nr:hypothetical protein LBMAG24_03480 [Bacteroidota bacterium]
MDRIRLKFEPETFKQITSPEDASLLSIFSVMVEVCAIEEKEATKNRKAKIRVIIAVYLSEKRLNI